MKLKAFALLAVAALFLLLGACSTQPPSGDNGLEDITWRLDSYGDVGNPQAVLDGTEITVTFDSLEGRAYGSSGANTYFSSYKVSGDKLSILEIAWTEMYRLDPPGVMEQEAAYLEIFQAVESYQVENGKLRINAGEQVLVYTAVTLGTLQGNVTIGPISPVVKPGETPTVPPEVYEARKIMVYDESGESLIVQVDINASGYYEAELEPGTYTVDINRIGMDYSAEVPKEIEIAAGKTVVLDIDIDTGIR